MAGDRHLEQRIRCSLVKKDRTIADFFKQDGTKGMDGMSSKKVEAFACSSCGSIRNIEQDADKCCTCSGCGVKVKKERGAFYISDSCSLCLAKGRVRTARDRVRKMTKDLAEAKKFFESTSAEYTKLTGKKPKAMEDEREEG